MNAERDEGDGKVDETTRRPREAPTITMGGHEIPVHTCPALVVGTGAAGLNAAVHLLEIGLTGTLVVTEALAAGTSRNAGSDKQTYYKTNVYGAEPDSPVAHARTLFEGGAMHGDVALVEATNSLREFFHLVQLGVPFPHDSLGGYVGYKTDHDPRQRATSAGPLTSRYMVDALLARLRALEGRVWEGLHVCRLLTDPAPLPVPSGRPASPHASPPSSPPSSPAHPPARRVVGALALDAALLVDPPATNPHGLVAFNTPHVVLATGGPACLYRTSVYPPSQRGSMGLALAAGARAQNLIDTQFGLASLAFRWNLSGSYQQVVPTYLSTDPSGDDPREFLVEAFPTPRAQAQAIFLKGYQWPFDVRKVAGGGSSLVDLLVTRERRVRGRRVWLDFRRNFAGFALADLDETTRSYLEACGALLPESPLARLRVLNPAAFQLYADHGIDLAEGPLEVAVCAQHLNGGLTGDPWWEAPALPGLFPVGEVNGTHGAYRPGGAALNAGQVGGLRAATRIHARRARGEPTAAPKGVAAISPPGASRATPLPLDEFERLAGAQIDRARATCQDWLAPSGDGQDPRQSLSAAWTALHDRVAAVLTHLRPTREIGPTLEASREALARVETHLAVADPRHLPRAFRLWDALHVELATLVSLQAHLARAGCSRGSGLLVAPAGTPLHSALPDAWRGLLGDRRLTREICEVYFAAPGSYHHEYVPVRPIPATDAWFENVWADFRGDP